MNESSDQSGNGEYRSSPLNLTEDEADYLWKMMVREVGKEEVQYGDDRETVESLHTKVRNLQSDTPEADQ